MTPSRRRHLLRSLPLACTTLLAAALLSQALTSYATPIDPDRKGAQRLDNGRVDWQRLDYKASKLFISASTTVRLEHVERNVADISFDTKAGGRRTSDTVRFRLDDADTIFRRKQKHGSKPYAKHYRYGQGRVSMERSEPADVDEATGKLDSWSLRKNETFDAPPGTCERVVDPSVILYLAAAHVWRTGGPDFEACTFSDGSFSRLVIRAEGEEEIDLDYEEVTDGTSRQRRETIRALVLSIDTEPLNGGEDRLEVLGLKEDIRVYVDPLTGAPLCFTGKMDVLGRVRVELQRLKRRGP